MLDALDAELVALIVSFAGFIAGTTALVVAVRYRRRIDDAIERSAEQVSALVKRLEGLEGVLRRDGG